MDSSPAFEIVIAGSSGVGKTSFLKRHLRGEFENNHVATLDVKMYTHEFLTCHGHVCFKLWDCAGQKKFRHIQDAPWVKAQGAIIMFDVTSPLSFEDAIDWRRDVLKVCGDIPVAIVGNKADLKERQVTWRKMLQLRGELSPHQLLKSKACRAAVCSTILCTQKRFRNRDVAVLIGRLVWQTRFDQAWLPVGTSPKSPQKIMDMSLKSCYHIALPFLFLARELTGYFDLKLV